MRVDLFLHKTLSNVINKKRLSTLILLVEGAMRDKELSVTRLGRSMETQATERSNIQRSDRFIGNQHIHDEMILVYETMAKYIIGPNKNPQILVDWSHMPNTKQYVLRAALVSKGRALTIYEQVHPKEKEGNPDVHKQFLNALKFILPEDCKPIIITDAGFQTPWFKMVLQHNWDYIGRVRARVQYNSSTQDEWQPIKNLYKKAKQSAEFIGQVMLGKTAKLKTNFYMIKQLKKGRLNLNKLGKKSRTKRDKEHSAAANEPWLLATSLDSESVSANRVMTLYAKRMQIEEAFRDLKSSKYGLSFEKAHSKSSKRIAVMLMIAMLVCTTAWIIGLTCEHLKLHYHFQANSVKTRRVVSLFFLGCRVIKKKFEIPIHEVESALFCYQKGAEYV